MLGWIQGFFDHFFAYPSSYTCIFLVFENFFGGHQSLNFGLKTFDLSDFSNIAYLDIEGSIRSPTLSQDSAKDVGAKTWRLETTFFSSMLVRLEVVCSRLDPRPNRVLTTELETNLLEIP